MIKCFAVDNSVQITANGSVQPCCKFRRPIGRYADYKTIPQVMADPQVQALRESHARGEWTKNCSRCERDEDIGARSRREYYDRCGFVDGEDFFLDISLGNHCNLKCRMCNPENSTQWNKDWMHLNAQGLAEDHSLETHMLTRRQIDRILNYIETRTGRVIIEIKGGEPFLSPNSEYFHSIAKCHTNYQTEKVMLNNFAAFLTMGVKSDNNFTLNIES